MPLETPVLHLLSQVPWQFFLTLTFKRLGVSATTARKMFFALHYQIGNWSGTDFGRLLWVSRAEFGEQTARLHLHSLLGGLPTWMITRRSCLAMMGKWESLGGGIARVYLYDQSRDALAYCMKGLAGDGSTQYESRKFGSASTVEFSKSAHRYLHRRRQIQYRGLRPGAGATSQVQQIAGAYRAEALASRPGDRILAGLNGATGQSQRSIVAG